MFANADYRIFTFAEDDGDAERSGGLPAILESELTAGKGGMGQSEAGVSAVREGDFPAEDPVEVAKTYQGEQRNGEAAGEVPK